MPCLWPCLWPSVDGRSSPWSGVVMLCNVYGATRGPSCLIKLWGLCRFQQPLLNMTWEYPPACTGHVKGQCWQMSWSLGGWGFPWFSIMLRLYLPSHGSGYWCLLHRPMFTWYQSNPVACGPRKAVETGTVPCDPTLWWKRSCCASASCDITPIPPGMFAKIRK